MPEFHNTHRIQQFKVIKFSAESKDRPIPIRNSDIKSRNEMFLVKKHSEIFR